MLPEDLKNYSERDGFQLMEPETAAALIFAGLLLCIVLDKLGYVFAR
jgi:hypothetical protein